MLRKNPIIRFCDEAWVFIVRKNGEAHIAVVDWEDVGKIAGYAWGLHSNGYASTRIGPRANRQTIYLHRVVLGLSDPDILVDHIDHDGLNCRKINLRHTNKSINGFHRKTFCGVYFSARDRKWIAQLGIPGADHPRRIGSFFDRRDAQQAVVDELYEIDPIAAKHREELMNAESY